MTCYVENEVNAEFSFGIEEILEAVAGAVLEQENCPYEAQVNLLVTDDEGIWELNRQYRQVDAPTDVLSFPMINYETAGNFDGAGEDMDCFDPASGELLLGDIIISEDKVREQADKYGHSLKREFAFLVAHSMLHLCGYDHMTGEEARVMEQKQEQVLNSLGITRDNG